MSSVRHISEQQENEFSEKHIRTVKKKFSKKYINGKNMSSVRNISTVRI